MLLLGCFVAHCRLLVGRLMVARAIRRRRHFGAARSVVFLGALVYFIRQLTKFLPLEVIELLLALKSSNANRCSVNPLAAALPRQSVMRGKRHVRVRQLLARRKDTRAKGRRAVNSIDKSAAIVSNRCSARKNVTRVTPTVSMRSTPISFS